MTQAEYNAKIQEMQRMWPGDSHRIRTHTDSKTGHIYQTYFQIYWDGCWYTLGQQYEPFTPEVRYEWWDVVEYKLRGKFADALIHS